MLFNSVEFVVFFCVVAILYYLPFLRKFQVGILILSSLYFYSAASLNATLLLIFSIAVNTWISYIIIHKKDSHRILYLTSGILINLGILLFFKYGPLLSITFIPEKLLNESWAIMLLHIPLPIGISFYTFEGISLLMDVLNKKYTPPQWVDHSMVKHLSNTALFISFFPHLIAGPILKAHHFIPQIQVKKYQNIDWTKVCKYLILGYFFKMVIADNLKEQTAFLIPPFCIYHPVELILMLFAYSIQIFTDFAGYSLIALGLAGILGYELIQNFNFPYISASLSEFWRRWHISLSSWLREYLYIPLGGNRKGSTRTKFNLMAVMTIGGLWHGASWNFAVWGLFHGSALVIERSVRENTDIVPKGWLKAACIFLVFVLVSLGWLLFKLPSFTEVIDYVRALGQWSASYRFNLKDLYILIYSIPVLIYYGLYLASRRSGVIAAAVSKHGYVVYGTMLFMIITNSGVPGSFIYFRF